MFVSTRKVQKVRQGISHGFMASIWMPKMPLKKEYIGKRCGMASIWMPYGKDILFHGKMNRCGLQKAYKIRH